MPYDLILLDCEMPIMDGYECVAQLKSLFNSGQVPKCPVIAQTGNARDSEIEKCKKAGMDDCLIKPILRKSLHEMILKWLNK